MQALAAFHAQRKGHGDAQHKSTFAQAKSAVDTFHETHRGLIANVGVLKQFRDVERLAKNSGVVKHATP